MSFDNIDKIVDSIRSMANGDPNGICDFSQRGIIFNYVYELGEYIKKTGNHSYDNEYYWIKDIADAYHHQEELYERYRSRHVPD